VSDFIEIAGGTKIFNEESYARSWDVDLGTPVRRQGNFFKECCNQVFDHHDGLPLLWAGTFDDEHYVVFIGEDFLFSKAQLEELKDAKMPDERVLFAIRWMCFRASVEETNQLLRGAVSARQFQESHPLIVVDEDYHHDTITVWTPPDPLAVLAIGGVTDSEIILGGTE